MLKKRGIRWPFLYAWLIVLGAWTLSHAATCGTLLKHDNAEDQREFENVYQSLCNPNISTGTAQNFTIVNGSATNLNVTGTFLVNGSPLSSTYNLVTTTQSFVSFATTSTSYVASPISKNYSSHAVGNKIKITFSGNIRTSNNSIGFVYASIFKATTDMCNIGGNTRGCSYVALGSENADVDVPGGFTVVDVSTTTKPVNYIFQIKVDAGVTGSLNNQSTFSQLVFDETGT